MNEQIKTRLQFLVTTADALFIAAIILHAFGKPIPWYLWAWTGVEVGGALVIFGMEHWRTRAIKRHQAAVIRELNMRAGARQ